jgi:hypothetical protein
VISTARIQKASFITSVLLCSEFESRARHKPKKCADQQNARSHLLGKFKGLYALILEKLVKPKLATLLKKSLWLRRVITKAAIADGLL